MEYDDIIVGAGSSGAVLAARLSEDPARSVLLLEAGPDYPTLEQTPPHILNARRPDLTGHDWLYTAEMVPGRDAEYPRGKVTGGSSAINATLALRGAPADYDEWAALGNDEWSWQRVLPYFRRLEHDDDMQGDLHGSGGPIPIRRPQPDELLPAQRGFLDACRTLGFASVTDHNDPEATGAGPGPLNVRDGIRISTAIAYLLPARHRLNLTIRPSCLVERVLLDGGRAVGIEVLSGGEVQRVEARRITLSAGSVGSAPILLRSGIGPKAHLLELGIEPRVDLPGVGETLIDHAAAGFNLDLRPGVMGDTAPIFQVLLRYTVPGSDEPNNMQTYLMYFPPGTSRLNAVLQRPRSRGRLRLTARAPQIQPDIRLNLLDDPEDLRRMMAGVRVAWQVAQSPSVAAFHEPGAILDNETRLTQREATRFFADDAALESYLRRTVMHFVHPVGTARMGPAGDPLAVVDQYCRVRGVENLRVVDASIMPSIPRANTNLTCIMIGERVADWMKET